MALRRRIVWRFSDIIISSKILIRHRASHDEHAGVHPNSDGGLWGKHNMIWIANLLAALVAVLHFYFLILEMFRWTRPLGSNTFRNSIEKAIESAVLAANHPQRWR